MTDFIHHTLVFFINITYSGLKCDMEAPQIGHA